MLEHQIDLPKKVELSIWELLQRVTRVIVKFKWLKAVLWINQKLLIIVLHLDLQTEIMAIMVELQRVLHLLVQYLQIVE